MHSLDLIDSVMLISNILIQIRIRIFLLTQLRIPILLYDVHKFDFNFILPEHHYGLVQCWRRIFELSKLVFVRSSMKLTLKIQIFHSDRSNPHSDPYPQGSFRTLYGDITHMRPDPDPQHWIYFCSF